MGGAGSSTWLTSRRRGNVSSMSCQRGSCHRLIFVGQHYNATKSTQASVLLVKFAKARNKQPHKITKSRHARRAKRAYVPLQIAIYFASWRSGATLSKMAVVSLDEQDVGSFRDFHRMFRKFGLYLPTNELSITSGVLIRGLLFSQFFIIYFPHKMSYEVFNVFNTSKENNG
jgi:hypothetical protein